MNNYTRVGGHIARDIIKERRLEGTTSPMMGGTYYYLQESIRGYPHVIVAFIAADGRYDAYWEVRDDYLNDYTLARN